LLRYDPDSANQPDFNGRFGGDTNYVSSKLNVLFVFINNPLQSNDWGTHLNSRQNHSYLAALNYGQVHCARLRASPVAVAFVIFLPLIPNCSSPVLSTHESYSEGLLASATSQEKA
jgi:hypothetical protein